MRYKKLLGLFVIIVSTASIFYGVVYYLSLRTLVISFRNVKEVNVYSSKPVDSGKNPKPMATISVSGADIRLRKGKYTLKYTGSDGYDSRFIEIDLEEKRQVVDINPSYSSEKLAAELNKEFPNIKAVLATKFSEIRLYEVRPGKLYAMGEWYGTTLKYLGTDQANSDSLRIILKKDSDKWQVKTDPPNISLSKHIYPEIPIEILRDVNNQ